MRANDDNELWNEILGYTLLVVGWILVAVYLVYYKVRVVRERRQHRKGELVLGTVTPFCFFGAHCCLDFKDLFTRLETGDTWGAMLVLDDGIALISLTLVGLLACGFIVKSLWWDREHPLFTHPPDWHGVTYALNAAITMFYTWYDLRPKSQRKEAMEELEIVYKILSSVFIYLTWVVVNYTASNVIKILIRHKTRAMMTQTRHRSAKDAHEDAHRSRAESLSTPLLLGRNYDLKVVAMNHDHVVIEDSVPWLLWAYFVLCSVNFSLWLFYALRTVFYVLPSWLEEEKWDIKLYNASFAIVLVFRYTSSVKLSYVVLNPRLNILYGYYQDLIRDCQLETDIWEGLSEAIEQMDEDGAISPKPGAGSASARSSLSDYRNSANLSSVDKARMRYYRTLSRNTTGMHLEVKGALSDIQRNVQGAQKQTIQELEDRLLRFQENMLGEVERRLGQHAHTVFANQRRMAQFPGGEALIND